MRRLLAFVHIEKAAGTTLLYLLRRNWLGRYMDVRPFARRDHHPGLFTADDLRTVWRMNPAIEVIGGHAVVPHADLETLVPAVRYVTLLREPRVRYVSQFLYWNRVLGKHWSFERFLDHEPSFDMQTRKIAGQRDAGAAGAILRERFLAVGLVEQFARFLVELSHAAGPRPFDPHYRERNVGSSDRDRRAQLLETYADAISERNAEDLKLYRYVGDTLLPAQAARFPGNLSAAVGTFEDRQARLAVPTVDLRLLADAALRKGWYEPVGGVIRRLHGLPWRGSY